MKCPVCFKVYSRSVRVPRVLFCKHTFCSPCLELMCILDNFMLTIKCPFCRKVSCLPPDLSVEEALYVDSTVWDQMRKNLNWNALEAEEEETEHDEKKGRSTVGAAASSLQCQRGKSNCGEDCQGKKC